MPTPSEYSGIPIPTSQTDTTTAKQPSSAGLSEESCATLQPLFDNSPDLRAAFGCDVKSETEPLRVDCDVLAQRLSDTIKSHLNDCIEPCRLSYEQCNACVRGSLDRDMQMVAAVADGCSQKIQSKLMDAFYDLVPAMETIGIQPPTPDQIQAILAGGPIPEPYQTITPIYQGPITPLTGVPVQSFPTDGSPASNLPITPTPFTPDVPDSSIPISKPLVCPPGTTNVGGPGGTCVPTQPPVVQPQPPTGGPGIYVVCPNSPNVPVQLVVSASATDAASGGGTVLSGPYPNSTDGGQAARQWMNSNQDAISQCIQQGPTGPISPNPPAPQPTPTCPQCQAGYAWSTDQNGNPVCKPSCQCPKCPEQPQPPQQPTGGGTTTPEQPTEPSVQLSCGPSARQPFEQWLNALSPSFSSNADYECKPGLGEFFIRLFATINPLSNSPPASDFTGHLSNTLMCLANWVYADIVKPAMPQGNCDVGLLLSHYFFAFVPNVINKLFNAIPPQVTATLEQRGNYICQYKTPSTDDLNTAWVHGVLTNEEWEFGVKINGDCLDWQKKLIESAYQSITWQDAFRLKRLGDIGGNEFTKWLQKNGINTDKDQDTFEKAYSQYPAMGDLIRMMVRDSADEQSVAENEFDQDFTDKFTGKLQKWADAQGVSEDVAKMYWRAHWTLPSPSQLYEMLHRLRENDRDPNDPYKDIIVTKDDVESVLKQNDNAPAWVPALMAISYPPLTRIDVKRGYEVGALDKNDVYRAYLDLGYSETNAKVLRDFTILASNPIRAKHDGAMSQAELAAAFNSRLISDDEMVDGLRIIFDNDKRVESVFKNQRFKREVAERKAIIAANKKRFMFGEYDATRTISELIGFGISNENAQATVNNWSIELAAKYKAPTVSMLCEWYTRGMITLDNYKQRVHNIGYDWDDALRIVSVCAAKNQEHIAKEVQAAKQKADSKSEKQRKALEKAARDAMPCRPTKPACPMPGANGKNGTH